ncbi:MAG: hypothetical protein IRZ03_17015, partial [Acidobacterium ailaaui]|nr:hypothetical protein [Pseudacidobacterium ailaaui]
DAFRLKRGSITGDIAVDIGKAGQGNGAERERSGSKNKITNRLVHKNSPGARTR